MEESGLWQGRAAVRMQLRIVVAMAALLAVWLIPAAARADIYWSNTSEAFSDGGYLGHAAYNGTGVNEAFVFTGAYELNTIASQGSYLYGDLRGGIGRVGINGSEPLARFIGGLQEVNAVAVSGAYIYFTNSVSEAPAIGRARLDGSEVIPDFISLGTEEAPESLAIAGGHIFWPDGDAIGRASLSGGEVEPGWLTETGAVYSVAANEGHIYWPTERTEVNEKGVEEVVGGAIARATLSGTDVEKEFIEFEKKYFFRAHIALDEEHIYLTVAGVEGIARASINGGGLEEDWLPADEADGVGVSPRVASVTGAPVVAMPENTPVTEEFTVSLNYPSSRTITVGYTTADGTATVANNDYTAAQGTLTFEPGQTEKHVPVQIDDGIGKDEAAKLTYQLKLTTEKTSGVGLSETASAATGTIGLPGIAGHLEGGKKAPLAGIELKITGVTDSGQAVTRTVTSEAEGNYAAYLDPGVFTVAPQGTPAGQPSGQSWSTKAGCPGTRSGGSCKNLTLAPAPGAVTAAHVDFIYGSLDPTAENLEVLQAVQGETWDRSAGELELPSATKVSAQEYTGVLLGAGSETIARLYAADNGTLTAESVGAELRAYTQAPDGSLIELPGGPIKPLAGPLDLAAAPQAQSERLDPSSSYNFKLPSNWVAAGRITLVGTVDPEHSFPECAGCNEDDSVALENVTFTAERTLSMYPMALTFHDKGKTVEPAGAQQAVEAAWPFFPLSRSQFAVAPELSSLDISAWLSESWRALSDAGKVLPHADLESLYVCMEYVECADVLAAKVFPRELENMLPDEGIPVGVYRGASFAGVKGMTGGAGDASVIAPDLTGANIESLPHELLHAIGFPHVAGCGAANAEPYPADPPNILGVGVNRALSGAGGIGPLMLGFGSTSYNELMSYCHPRWISSVKWNQVVNRLASGSLPQEGGAVAADVSRSPLAKVAAAAGMSTVTAVLIAGKPVIASFAAGLKASAARRSPYTLTGTSAGGRAVQVAMSESKTELDGSSTASSGETVFLTALVPDSALASLTIRLHGKVLARLKEPRRLKVRLVGAKKRLCPRAGRVTVRFKSNLPALSLSVTRLQVGRKGHFKTVASGGNRGSISVARANLAHSLKGLSLRLTISDGAAHAELTRPLAARC